MSQIITVFEHEQILVARGGLTAEQLKRLQVFHEAGNGRYFDLLHRGIRFKQYVGVLQVGQLTIEILPKADRVSKEQYWRESLHHMLRVVYNLRLHAPSTSHLRTRPNDLLELYFALLLQEAHGVLSRGLVKRYRGEERQSRALSGRLLFADQVRKNLVHRERFYVATTAYDHHHALHQILRQAVDLVRRLTGRLDIEKNARNILSLLPKLPELPVSEAVFDRIRFDRKTQHYQPAVGIARLLLLNYHPDVTRGGAPVLALLFNMNRLWESYLAVRLRKLPAPYTVQSQLSVPFWWPSTASPSYLRPDIVLEKNRIPVAVFDAKWKVPPNDRPAAGDLQQLFTYSRQFSVNRVGLLYPAGKMARPRVQGRFGEQLGGVDCGCWFLTVDFLVGEIL